MMRLILMLLTLFLVLGCGSKTMKVSGMICPPGHTEDMVHEDFRACRAYDEKAAARASEPKLTEECVECLQERGYKVDE